MTRQNSQSGSLHLGLLLGLVVVAAVAFAGYRVFGAQKAVPESAASVVGVPTAIHTKADLTQTSKALDASSTELDSSLNDASLDGDINSML